MDVVYLVKNCIENEELTYSLRSLVNIPHDKVFIVGGCPHNVDKRKVTYISIPPTVTKYKTTTNNLKSVCLDSRLSSDFILMNDDFFILKPIKNPRKELNLCRGTIKDVLKEMSYRHSVDSQYMLGMKQAEIFLSDLGHPEPLSYELHIPMVMNKEKFLSIFQLPYIDSIKVLHKRTIYGNLFMKDSTKIRDVKVYRDFFTPIGSDKFLSTEDISFRRVKGFLTELFPKKSEFEF